jgi:hypothetical protein
MRAYKPSKPTGLEERDEDDPRHGGSRRRHDQGARPGLREHGLEQKRDEKKGCDREAQRLEEQQIGNHGDKADEHPLP